MKMIYKIFIIVNEDSKPPREPQPDPIGANQALLNLFNNG